jgi:hypothetical protein
VRQGRRNVAFGERRLYVDWMETRTVEAAGLA